MVLDKTDVKVEQKVEREGRKEILELKEASELVFQVGVQAHEGYSLRRNRPSKEVENELRKKLEDAAREIATARIHNQRVRKLAKRLYKDMKDIRGAKEKQLREFLTKNEAFILGSCNNLNHLLDEARAIVQQAITGTASFSYYDIYTTTDRAYKAIVKIIQILRELFYIEHQVETATEKYVGT
jgi:hypothetical protein|tara:strand:+ start:481 stop:1032 length:552 start_codon:yes stop_codon:yes gene_type:complete